jgi:CelD/BcsL family acetyltransferase involved in cellulose biosynthesis
VSRSTGIEPENALAISRIEDWNSLSELRPDWEMLLDRVPDASIFQTFQWNSSWWRAFGKGDRLLVISCRKGHELVGIAPLMITRGRFSTLLPRTELRFIGCKHYSSDYLDFIIDPDVPNALNAILDEILGYLGEVSRIRFSNFPTHFVNYSRVNEYLRSQKVRFTVELDHKAPYRLLGNKEEDHRTVNKSALRRKYNFFRKTGNVHFQKFTCKTEILAYMDRFFDQHVARREVTRIPSEFRNPDQRAFYRELVMAMQPSEWLRFDAVLFNDQPIAFHFGFEFRNRFIWYKPTFDIQYSRNSPGMVLIKYLLEDAIDRDLDEFDFTVGSEPFKYRFANRERINNRIIVFRFGTDRWAHRFVMALVKRIKHVMRVCKIG